MAGPPPQAGILEGANPVAYNASSPITLFIIQASIVIIFCQLLHYPLRLLNQPRVIAEVIGGVILGPSVMMRIPGFKASIFPPDSIPVFSNVANLGLIIFLFLVDIRLFTANWRVALSVGLAGMVIPFGLGVAIAWGLYHQFRTDAGIVEINFGVYALFIGTALAITAFPVLCRILTELKLLRSNVGVTVLAAGIGNDVTGWILLALCVALVNNNSGLAALWALLTAVAWTLFLVFAVRPVFMWTLRRTGSIQNGPTQGMVALTMLLTLISSWFTGIIGIHPIFGAFLVGLICPHDGGFAIKLTEKIEDLITVIFLPLYFALSGLSTDLGLLNDGITWGYVIAVIVIAFSGKIIGGTLAAKACGLLWRESTTIGVLMSCKGLVELIVLNIGLQAKILSARTFTMFVVMALVTTVSTTPLTKLLYPPWYQQKVERWRRGEIDWDGNPTGSSADSTNESVEKLNATQIRRLLVYLRLDSLPSLFTFITLLGAETSHAAQEAAAASATEDTVHIRKRPLEVHGLRIIELTERTSSVMQVTEGEEYYSAHDPVVNAFRTFSQLHDVAAAGRVAVVPVDSYPETLMSQAADVSSDFALIPWSEYGSVTEDQSVPYAINASERFKSGTHLDFIQKTLARATQTCNTGIFINNGFGGVVKTHELRRTRSAMSVRSAALESAVLPVTDKSHHVFFPFFGGVDDRVALRFVLQLAKNPVVTLTITHFNFSGAVDEIDTAPLAGASSVLSKIVPGTTTSSLDPTKSWAAEAEVSAHDLVLLHTLQSSLPQELVGRVTFKEVSVSSASVLKKTVDVATGAVGKNPKNAGDIVVVGRRHTRLGDDKDEVSGGDFKKTVGVVADQFIAKGVKASLLVIQAGGRGLES
ncbi:putative K(+)/H(+) antiporter protein [Coniochaeta ligniaria NRRL 30616]|uniref:Putative K(+)/H(+) antiporter protein n=1 Tax=Coniochaeta ligniaria NRRL 30616 TaxID=1408157 RepID=A0A1J7IAM1_9PEZI|nr:putative K(+)/H(+) antiporter protein [Coniochaeta ligniaria NRRL 30616]